jgi:rhamnulokinase
MEPAPLADRRARVAVDLGAESCRVSLLRWHDGEPKIELLHRIANGPVQMGSALHWPLDRILAGVEEGLRKAAEAAPEGIASIAVDGWAVDYVRLGPDGEPVHPPFCYRDERNALAKAEADAMLAPGELFALTGAQPLRINTLYQLIADLKAAAKGDGAGHSVGPGPGASDGHSGAPKETRGIFSSIPEEPWVLLPEYVLYWLGGRRVAEYTNATHTGLVDLNVRNKLESHTWSNALFERFGLNPSAAPPIVPSGTVIGQVSGPLADLPAFAETDLLVPACHDTASAIAAIGEDLENTAYIVSGTWSLVGTVVDRPINLPEAYSAGFTNQGAAAGGYCFHTNVNGMWLLKQCMDAWCAAGREIDLVELVAKAADVAEIPGWIDVDSPPLLLAGEMPARINAQLEAQGLAPIADVAGNEPVFARVIFASLARRYAAVLRNLESLTGRRFERITILGGGSRNKLLSQLTEQSTGLPVIAGEAEGSTIGNFAVQLAAAAAPPGESASPAAVRAWASRLTARV